jgi:hypothetical protein
VERIERAISRAASLYPEANGLNEAREHLERVKAHRVFV